MAELDTEAARPQLQAYLEQLGYEFAELPTGWYAVAVEVGEENVVACLAVLDDYLAMWVHELIQVPPAATSAALREIMHIHWRTYLPKYEWNRSDGVLQASWYLPLAGGFPTIEHVRQALQSLCESVVRDREAIEAASRVRGVPIGAAGERLPAAAELDTLGRNLVELATEHELTPKYVRKDLVRKLIGALSVPNQQILLVGEPGTGKNALLYALAAWIAHAHAEVKGTELEDRRIYECVPASFQVGVMYANELENKIQMVAENCSREQALLFVDEAHLAVTQGRVGDMPDRTIANLLIPYMQRREVTLIGATTPAGVKLMKRENRRFMDCFHVIEVPETSTEETVAIVAEHLDAYVQGTRGSRTYRFAEGFAGNLVALADRFIPHRRNPGKSLELVESVVTRAAEAHRRKACEGSEIEEAISERTGLRRQLVKSDLTLRGESVVRELTKKVIGQDAAVREMADVILTYKAGLNRVGRPIETMLFMGPTGVGKTQLARSLAEYMFGSDASLLRYDMSEYADPTSFIKLCGDRRADEPGRLVGDVLAKPCSVVLLDEIEKAHSTVFNVLLQVLDEGRLTDANGTTASFENTIVIMTSNVGAHLYARKGLGFGQDARPDVSLLDLQKEIEKGFAPEFVNRIGRTVVFSPLELEAIRAIALREAEALGNREGLKGRGIGLKLSERLLDQIISAGYDPRFGARAMQRTIERLVASPVAEYLCRHKGVQSLCLEVDCTEDGTTVVRG